jgi:CubicO group peptidase (beta-lactamase class C family)
MTTHRDHSRRARPSLRPTLESLDPRLLLASVATIIPSTLDQRVRIALQKYLDNHSFPGISVGIVIDDQSALATGYGLAEVETVSPPTGTPVDGDTKRGIGSITKTFTGLVLYKLQQQLAGTDHPLDLDKPIGDYLEFLHRDPQDPSKDVKLPENWEPLTIRQLVTMSSGIRDVGHSIPWYDQIRDMDQTLVFTPGTGSLYSNANFYVLGALIEHLSGKTYQDYIRDNILEPLEMHDTAALGDHETTLPNQAVGYEPFDTSTGQWPVATLWDGLATLSAGSVVTTAEDMVKYMRGMFEGKIIGTDGYDLLWASTPRRAYSQTDDQPSNPPRFSFFGSGWDKVSWSNEGVVSAEKNGGVPGYSADILLFPMEKTGVFLAYNMDPLGAADNPHISQVMIAEDILKAIRTAAVTGVVSTPDFFGGEIPLAGWTVYVDANHNGKFDSGEIHGSTGPDGGYVFGGLDPGSHRIGVVIQPGWKPLQPPTGSASRNMIAGEVMTQDFSVSPLASVASVQSLANLNPSSGAVAIKFDNDLNPSTATNPFAYTLQVAGRDRRFDTRDDQFLRVRGATYNVQSRTVTLFTPGRLPTNQAVQLRISAEAVRSLGGEELDGNHDGFPGDDYVGILPRRPVVVPRGRPRA